MEDFNKIQKLVCRNIKKYTWHVQEASECTAIYHDLPCTGLSVTLTMVDDRYFSVIPAVLNTAALIADSQTGIGIEATQSDVNFIHVRILDCVLHCFDNSSESDNLDEVTTKSYILNVSRFRTIERSVDRPSRSGKETMDFLQDLREPVKTCAQKDSNEHKKNCTKTIVNQPIMRRSTVFNDEVNTERSSSENLHMGRSPTVRHTPKASKVRHMIHSSTGKVNTEHSSSENLHFGRSPIVRHTPKASKVRHTISAELLGGRIEETFLPLTSSRQKVRDNSESLRESETSGAEKRRNRQDVLLGDSEKRKTRLESVIKRLSGSKELLEVSSSGSRELAKYRSPQNQRRTTASECQPSTSTCSFSKDSRPMANTLRNFKGEKWLNYVEKKFPDLSESRVEKLAEAFADQIERLRNERKGCRLTPFSTNNERTPEAGNKVVRGSLQGSSVRRLRIDKDSEASPLPMRRKQESGQQSRNGRIRSTRSRATRRLDGDGGGNMEISSQSSAERVVSTSTTEYALKRLSVSIPRLRRIPHDDTMPQSTTVDLNDYDVPGQLGVNRGERVRGAAAPSVSCGAKERSVVIPDDWDIFAAENDDNTSDSRQDRVAKCPDTGSSVLKARNKSVPGPSIDSNICRTVPTTKAASLFKEPDSSKERGRFKKVCGLIDTITEKSPMEEILIGSLPKPGIPLGEMGDLHTRSWDMEAGASLLAQDSLSGTGSDLFDTFLDNLSPAALERACRVPSPLLQCRKSVTEISSSPTCPAQSTSSAALLCALSPAEQIRLSAISTPTVSRNDRRECRRMTELTSTGIKNNVPQQDSEEQEGDSPVTKRAEEGVCLFRHSQRLVVASDKNCDLSDESGVGNAQRVSKCSDNKKDKRFKCLERSEDNPLLDDNVEANAEVGKKRRRRILFNSDADFLDDVANSSKKVRVANNYISENVVDKECCVKLVDIYQCIGSSQDNNDNIAGENMGVACHETDEAQLLADPSSNVVVTPSRRSLSQLKRIVSELEICRSVEISLSSNEGAVVVSSKSDEASSVHAGVVPSNDDASVVLSSKDNVGVVLAKDDDGIGLSEDNAGVMPSKGDGGTGLSKDYPSVVPEKDDTCVLQSKDSAGFVQSKDDDGVVQLKDDDGVVLSKDNAGVVQSKPKDNAGVVGSKADADIELLKDDASVVQSNDNASVAQTKDSAGVVQSEGDGGIGLSKDDAGVVQSKDNASVAQTKDSASVAQTKDSASVAQTKDSASVAQTKDSASVAQTKDSASVAQTKDSAGVVQSKGDGGIGLSKDDAGVRQSNDVVQSEDDPDNMVVDPNNTRSVDNDERLDTGINANMDVAPIITDTDVDMEERVPSTSDEEEEEIGTQMPLSWDPAITKQAVVPTLDTKNGDLDTEGSTPVSKNDSDELFSSCDATVSYVRRCSDEVDRFSESAIRDLAESQTLGDVWEKSDAARKDMEAAEESLVEDSENNRTDAEESNTEGARKDSDALVYIDSEDVRQWRESPSVVILDKDTENSSVCIISGSGSVDNDLSLSVQIIDKDDTSCFGGGAFKGSTLAEKGVSSGAGAIALSGHVSAPNTDRSLSVEVVEKASTSGSHDVQSTGSGGVENSGSGTTTQPPSGSLTNSPSENHLQANSPKALPDLNPGYPAKSYIGQFLDFVRKKPFGGMNFGYSPLSSSTQRETVVAAQESIVDVSALEMPSQIVPDSQQGRNCQALESHPSGGSSSLFSSASGASCQIFAAGDEARDDEADCERLRAGSGKKMADVDLESGNLRSKSDEVNSVAHRLTDTYTVDINEVTRLGRFSLPESDGNIVDKINSGEPFGSTGVSGIVEEDRRAGDFQELASASQDVCPGISSFAGEGHQKRELPSASQDADVSGQSEDSSPKRPRLCLWNARGQPCSQDADIESENETEVSPKRKSRRLRNAKSGLSGAFEVEKDVGVKKERRKSPNATDAVTESAPVSSVVGTSPAKRPRGRPRKIPLDSNNPVAAASDKAVVTPSQKRPRGRPRKTRKTQDLEKTPSPEKNPIKTLQLDMNCSSSPKGPVGRPRKVQKSPTVRELLDKLRAESTEHTEVHSAAGNVAENEGRISSVGGDLRSPGSEEDIFACSPSPSKQVCPESQGFPVDIEELRWSEYTSGRSRVGEMCRRVMASSQSKGQDMWNTNGIAESQGFEVDFGQSPNDNRGSGIAGTFASQGFDVNSHD